MQDLDMKKKVIQEVIDLMEAKQGDKLKSHPKLMASKIEVAKGEPDEVEMSEEKPEIELEMGGPEKDGESEEELSPEMLQKLLEQLKD